MKEFSATARKWVTMKEVYLVFENDGHEHKLCSVFSTPEKAEAEKETLERQAEQHGLDLSYFVDKRTVQ